MSCAFGQLKLDQATGNVALVDYDGSVEKLYDSDLHPISRACT